MFKMLDKLKNYWQKKRDSFIMRAKVTILFLGLIYTSYLIAPYLQLLPYFSNDSRFDISFLILCIFMYVCIVSAIVIILCEKQREKKAEERLKNRELLDYVEKYKEYVDFVKQEVQTQNYQEVYLSNDWVKEFDQYLDQFARHRRRQERDFTDFEVVACLMYALTYESDEDDSIVNVSFAFQCAKAFLHAPNIYQCKRIEGYELILEQSESMEEISFENVNDVTLGEMQAIISVYLSQREFYSQMLGLADFLHIFYLRCKK